MRVRRLSALFWATCIFVVIFILYVITDMRLPGTKPLVQEIDDSKWLLFENKINTIEKELTEHQELVGQIKTAVNEMVGQSYEQHSKEQILKALKKQKEKQFREFILVGDEPPKMRVKFDTSECPMQKQITPKTDIQMLSMYDRIMFDDKDGGVWKQGWDIEYSSSQWNQKNKLKVFIVPHSHNDPGWIKTFEEYYNSQTKAIFKNMVEKLQEMPGRKFIWAETSYLSLWWNNDATHKEKDDFKKLLKSGNIEIVTGGWVMNDEANSHWLSIIQQLTTGHQWLIDNLGYIPKNAWAIDPFGHSSSQPYLLQLAGFENSVIQRVHYRVKKELALNKQLEFKWRQLWDGFGKTDMFTHMMPFYSYDVPHTCGPDPKICCQFDFRRLPGNGVNCPWGLAPKKIIQKNVGERSSLIIDQWRKKAQLYRSNVLMIPLGDDFRYDRANEWDNQYKNYEMLIDYINNNDDYNIEVQFGTLQDYFKALHQDVKMTDFPVLSGDFFTYADRNQHYWSGYYTSRPFYKNMDRVLLAYVRAAETITAQAIATKSVTYIMWLQMRDRVEEARRSLALFQHHDGITGTSRDPVREDYAIKMLKAIKHCQSAVQQAAFYLLKQPSVLEQRQPDLHFDVDDIWRSHDEIPSRITITLDRVSPSRRIVLYNALSFRRHEVFSVLVSSPHVEVFDPEGNPIMAQISPVVTGTSRLGFSNKYELSFLVTVEPLALTMYTVALRDSMAINKFTSFSRIRIYNADYMTVDLPKIFVLEQPTARLSEEVTVRAVNGTKLVVNKNGLIKALVSADGVTVPVHMDFVQYGTLRQADNNSGAYLFIPDGPGQEIKPPAFPEIIITEGPFKATLHTILNAPNSVQIYLAVSLYNNPFLAQTEVEISHTLLIEPAVHDLELAMRFSTEVKNEDIFYTDLNGMQMIKRRYFKKIPLQANFYPLPGAAYIEDDAMRFTILTSTPLGVAALQPGQIEVMQDRRLSRDDNRGVNQGVLDNVRTRHTFRVIVESANTPCQQKPPSDHPSGQLSLGTHVSQQTLLQPLIAMQYPSREDTERPHFTPPLSSAADLVLASFRAGVSAKNKGGNIVQGFGMTFQRIHFDSCFGSKEIVNSFPVGDGQISLSEWFEVPPDQIYDSSLTFVEIRQPLPEGVLTLCPMEVRSVFINDTGKHH